MVILCGPSQRRNASSDAMNKRWHWDIIDPKSASGNILEAENGNEKMGNPKMDELTRAASFLNPGHFPGNPIGLFI
jgi:hypothetical protein